jgi:hypothetical protein
MVVGGGVGASITGESCVTGCGGCNDGSAPTEAGGMAGPFAGSSGGMSTFTRGEPSGVRTAFRATCRPGAGAALIGVPAFRLFRLDPLGIKFEVLGPGAGAAGTKLIGAGAAPGSAVGGANPLPGPMPAGGWFVNCGLLPIGAKADGSPCGWFGRAQPVLVAVDAVAEVGIAVGGVTLVVAAAGFGGRWKLALAPEPAQPVNDPADNAIVSQAPTVRVVMPVPLDRAEGATRWPPGKVPSPRARPPQPALP